jgi:hypothetical protein
MNLLLMKGMNPTRLQWHLLRNTEEGEKKRYIIKIFGTEAVMNNLLFSAPFRTGLRLFLLVAVLAMGLGPVGAGTVYAAPPSNDNFANAIVVTGIPFHHTADTRDATTQNNEPKVPVACEGKLLEVGQKTVWYRYQPTTNRGVHVDTKGSDYDTFIAVWRGTSLGNLVFVGCDDDTFENLQSDLVFAAQAGNTYYIQVAAYGGTQGNPQPHPGGILQFNVSSFEDVPSDYWAWTYIEGLYGAGVTGGCSTTPLLYCPMNVVTRDQMAVFLLKAKYGGAYNAPPAGGSTGFSDVPANYWAAAWIKQLATEGITGGCGVGIYCPVAPVTRDQMAVFLLKAKYGPTYNPPPVGSTTGFADVPTNYWAAAWIKRLAAEGITGGCGGNNFCPGAPVTRDQMAVFLIRTFNIPTLP